MEKLSTNEIRRKWLKFFESKNHKIIKSRSLVPNNDPSLLWINSGVATLKPYFSGEKIPPSPRLVNSQLSLRTNDIENVGITSRHHTLFEMLGNFSIGDYFKEEALEYAFEFVFDVLKFDKEKVYITYYEKDKVTYDKWVSLGIDPSHLIKGTKESNFWDVGKGPCGPDTELFYDRGDKYSDLDPIKAISEDIENDRYIEFWNIVFSQLNNDGNGNYEELKQKNIDTGAGLERIASIMQETDTNYETDNFAEIIESINGENIISKRIIADHMRAATFTINNGIEPSNVGRGYIVRRLIRRAAFKAYLMDKENILKVIDVVDIIKKQFIGFIDIDEERVKEIIKKEILSFEKNIQSGLDTINKMIEKNEKFTDKVVFKLFETYGYPMELTQDTLARKGIEIDLSNMDKLREEHAAKSKGKTKAGMKSQIKSTQRVTDLCSKFVGYDKLETKSEVIHSIEEKGKWYTLVKQTPFYATSGGQAADQGKINSVVVRDVFKDKYGNHWHITDEKLSGVVTLSVDKKVREQAENNHSATHLLFSTLRKIYGPSIKQLGSDNNFNRLRLDFPLDHRPSESEIEDIESTMKELINSEIERKYINTTFDAAEEMGAIALENEDYGYTVRVVKFGDMIELCGGTHAANTKQIQDFVITKVESIGSGVYRIKALTGIAARKYKDEELSLWKSNYDVIKEKLKEKNYWNFKNPSTVREYKSEVERLRKEYHKVSKTKRDVVDVNISFEDYKGLKAHINLNYEGNNIKAAAATLRDANKDAVIILGQIKGEKHLIVVASSSQDSILILKSILEPFGGRGGGAPKLAMGAAPEIIRTL